ncbi:MAG TPA: threonine synthase [Mycobacteriales bacterium]|nr:threonine synthase [Mycobacteriales bacterium]
MTLTADAPTSSAADSLRCRNCGARFPLGPQHACFECFGPLEIGYDHDALAALTRAGIEAGPQSIWRYAGLLPVGQDPAGRVTLNPGMTPLVRADRLAEELGMRELWVKDDSANPTHSFKDRVVSVALTAARQLGFTRVACASTGNLANSVAAHAARAGLDSVVLIPADLEEAKVVQTAVYGGTLVAVDGSYDDVNRLCSELAETDAFEKTAFVNVNVRPYYAEGSKTLGYEVAEQLGWRLPRQVLIPMASGSMLTKIDKAFGELASLGLVEPAEWRVFGAQSSGCAPISTAFARGRDVVEPVRPTGIAKSLAIGNPADGPYALDAVRRTGGAVADVGDDEIRDGIELLARTTGIFAETAGGVVVATLRKLIAAGALDPAEQTVIYNTGDGLKTLDAIAARQAPTVTVKPSLRSAREAGLLD